MELSRTKRPIAWAVALGAVVIGWELNFPTFFVSIADDLGAAYGSLPYLLVVDAGVPATLLVITWLAVHFYEDVLWQWIPALGCKRGWWVYGLIAEHGESNVLIVGFFKMLDGVAVTQIVDGHAFYSRNGKLTVRGNWTADVVWVTSKAIRFIFDMHAVSPTEEGIPSAYEGYMALSRTFAQPSTGKETWEGYFHDLRDRRAIAGQVCAERLSIFSARSRNRAEQLMREHAIQLLTAAESGVA